MTILEQDLKVIKTMIMQKRGGYHISEDDKKNLHESLSRITAEAQEALR